MPRETRITPLAVAYSRSLLELANEQNMARQVGEELEALAKMVDGEPAFGEFLASPTISEAEHAQVLDKALRGRVLPLLLNFLQVANRKGRLGMLRQMADAYAELLEKQMGIIEVDVIVSQKLTPRELDQVRQKVSAALKREAVVHQYVDDKIIGGLVLRVDDRLFDGSIRAQLRAVRRQLLAARQR